MNKVSFKMTISKIISIKVGSVLSGIIDTGKIEVGNKVEFENQEGKQELEIIGISDNTERKRVKQAEKGQNVALLVKVKQCGEIGLEEGMSIYISEKSDEDYFNDLFGDLEDKEVIAKNNLKEAEKAEYIGLHGKAFDYYLKAAELGELPEAQYKIGEYYYDFCEGEDKLEIDLTEEEAIAKAMEYYEKAANQGNANAQYQLYTIFYDGYYVDEDDEEAFKWGMKAANQGMKEAEYAIGDAYRFGELGEKNDEEAIKWYERAAEHGLAEASITLGDIYESGGSNVQKNYKKSFEYYMKAAKEGRLSENSDNLI